MTIRVIKLTSGDTIVGDIVPVDQFNWVVSDPIQVTIGYTSSGSGTMVASRWLETDQTKFNIREIHIVAQADPTEMLLDYYYECVQDVQNTSLDTELEDELIHTVCTKIMH